MNVCADYAVCESHVNCLTTRIEREGFTVRLVDYCEDPETPGFLGQIAGATSHKRKTVKVRTAGRSDREIAETLAHELRHVLDPAWDCGNRDVFGR